MKTDRQRCVRLVGWVLAAGLSAWQAHAQPTPVDASAVLMRYKIKAGDTFNKIANAYLRPEADLAQVAQINQIKDLDLILAGAEMQIPKSFIKDSPTNATVLNLSCAAPIRLLNNQTELSVGQKIYEGAVIDVPAQCHATLVLEDGSLIRLPSSAAVKVATLKKNLLQSAPEVKLELSNGRVELEVHKGRGQHTPFEVQTPISIMGVRGTEFRVGYSEQEQTGQVEVLEGTVQTQGAHDADAFAVAMGYGAPISREGKVLGIEKLLPAPVLEQASALEGSTSTYLIKLQPIDHAGYYLADSSPNANTNVEQSTQRLLAPEFLTSGLSQQAVFYQFKAVSASTLLGQASVYAFCITPQDVNTCAVLFDTPLANGANISFSLQKQTEGQAQSLINVSNLRAKKGRFNIQGLHPGKYNWVLSYTSNTTSVTQVGEFELVDIHP